MHIYFNPNFPLQKRSKIRRLLCRAATVTRRFFADSFIASSLQDLLTRLDIYVTNSLNLDEMLDRRLTCSGESFDSGVIFLDFTKQVEFNRNEFIALIFHECIHGLRASLTTKNSDLGVSLFDYVINEGLAFKAERLLALNQSIARPAFLWPNKLSRSQLLDGLREMLRVEQSGEAWDFDDWFYNFTRRRPDFPKNFAYSIGEFVVDEFMRQKQLDFVSVLTTETSVLQQYAVMLMEKKMRVLLLGNVRKNQKLKQRITLAKQTLRQIVEQTLGKSAWRRKLDLICFIPNQVSDSDGVEFRRFENYAYILIDPGKNPTSVNILATMLQVALFFWFDAEKRAQFSSQFLFDLYKTGASLWLVNQLTAANWCSDDLDEAMFANLKQIAGEIVVGKAAYDESFWLDDSGKNSYFVLWFFGERVMKELLTDGVLSWREIDQVKLEQYFAKNDKTIF